MNHRFRALFLACGLGAVARGAVAAKARLGQDEATFENAGGIDIDGAACADFEMLTGKRALQADLHELTPADLLEYAGPRVPDAVISSPPCKGFSQLISKEKALEEKYQRLNELVYRCIFLSCETWSRPPPLICLENVPGIQGRGKDVLDRAKRILHAYGYMVHEGTHDCGEIGNLAQHRKRYLLVARLPSSVTAFVHRPPKHRVRACGEVLSQLPMPYGPEAQDAGPMHLLPNISLLTKVRLALIPPGGDWRDLPPAVQLGVDGSKFRGSPGLFNHCAVRSWDQPALSVIGATRPDSGAQSVADVRPAKPYRNGQLGVVGWEEPMKCITGNPDVQNGPFACADPRDRKALAALVIVSRFNTWNRPISTLELAMLQGLPARLKGKPLVLAGTKTLGWRERIGNAIPEGAAEAIATSLLKALLASKVGGWFVSNDELWVRKRDHYVMPDELEAFAP